MNSDRSIFHNEIYFFIEIESELREFSFKLEIQLSLQLLISRTKD